MAIGSPHYASRLHHVAYSLRTAEEVMDEMRKEGVEFPHDWKSRPNSRQLGLERVWQ
ncbi:hypothetical protein PHLCEN_2v1351 [Hermanssonia centrifuga]|uniref:Uncharacterized protein n=1 Tax=Hermanssonia centrifuga TaxID=98765 RepID=A0A2R6S3E5_9APHY|nr:hypothetical protein PHLCEN_2v1351 [Hermanssonia centrifuga]